MHDIVCHLEPEHVGRPQSDLDWPTPPYFELDGESQPDGPEPCRIWRSQGSEHDCLLMRFSPGMGHVAVQKIDSSTPETISLAAIKLLKLLRPRRLKKREASVTALADAVLPVSDTQTFAMAFTHGEVLQGETAGYVSDSHGVFLFQPVDGGLVERCFAPHAAVRSFTLGAPVGEMLVAADKVSQHDVDAAMEEQTQRRTQRLGDLLAQDGLVSREEIAAALEQQKKMPTRRLGDFLREKKFISQAQLEAALARQAEKRHLPLGQILLEMNVVDEQTLHHILARKLGVPFVRLAKFPLDPGVVSLVGEKQAQKHRIVPLYRPDGTLVLAMENPLDLGKLDDLRFRLGLNLVPVMASRADIDAALKRCRDLCDAGIPLEMPAVSRTGDYTRQKFESDSLIDDLASQLVAEDEVRGVAEEEHVNESDSTLVRLVNKMILDAQAQGASDIHIESNPGKQTTRVRFRTDGVLREYLQVPAKFRSALASRIKIMAKLDISERRRPQDGKIDFRRFARRELELRVATIPTANGLEDLVLRLLGSTRALPLEALGASPEVLAALKRSVLKPFGLILVCGPTGSGKTTTLHSLLGHLNTEERKIWTAEDPIEITQPGLRQVQVHSKIGWTFASALRALLRADPDVIMVGEMRDHETATTAVEASLTGHLVLSTLHTNSAAESVVRLLDLGVDPFTVADSLVAVLAQRLVRQLCSACREPSILDDAALEKLAAEYCTDAPAQVEETKRRWQALDRGALALYHAKGCRACAQSGYQGRIALHELLLATPKIKHLVQTRATASEIREAACRAGMLTLKQDGIERALAGLTDLTQVRGSCGE